MSRIQLKLVGRDSKRSTGPALNPMACVDNLAKLYFRIGFNNKEILAVLAQNHSVVISVMTLKRLCGKLRLFRRRIHTNEEEVAVFMQTELAGNGQTQGYR